MTHSTTHILHAEAAAHRTEGDLLALADLHERQGVPDGPCPFCCEERCVCEGMRVEERQERRAA